MFCEDRAMEEEGFNVPPLAKEPPKLDMKFYSQCAAAWTIEFAEQNVTSPLRVHVYSGKFVILLFRV